MNPTEHKIAGKWLEIKGELQKSWGKLTDSDLDQTKGDLKAISGLLQQKYGKAQATYTNTLNEIFARFEEKKDTMVEQIKTDLKN
jgi:uncharacterized protein YjbJ (UPF0337 family)